MSEVVICAEKIGKQYRLGAVGRRTLHADFNRWLYKFLGKDDPYLKIGDINDRTTVGSSEYIWALSNINFEVRQGEVLGVIGRNGAGKSTLLKLLSKVTAPSEGVLKIKGRIAALLEVGTGFHPELSGRDNIFLNGAILGMTRKEIQKKLDEIIAFAGIERYVNTPVKRYSSGMYVRLAFAVAAHLEPDILVVDEVLAVGDAEFQQKCLGKMKDVSEREGRTVLFVSHQMASIQNLCNSTIVLSKGMVDFFGKTDIAIQHYLNDVTQINNNDLRLNRKGNGNVVVTQIEVLKANKQGEAIGVAVSSGDAMILRFAFQRLREVKNLSSRLDFRIEDSRGNRVCWLSTSLQKIAVLDIAKDLQFFIKKVPFNAGTYYITHCLYVDGNVTDWVQNSFRFEVQQADFFLTGEIVPSDQSSILIPFNLIN